jgi:hypothetical protein
VCWFIVFVQHIAKWGHPIFSASYCALTERPFVEVEKWNLPAPTIEKLKNILSRKMETKRNLMLWKVATGLNAVLGQLDRTSTHDKRFPHWPGLYLKDK